MLLLGDRVSKLKEILGGWKFIAASYVVFTVCTAVKVVKTSIRTGISITELWRKTKKLIMMSLATGSTSAPIKESYKVAENDFNIKPEFSSELSIASPGTTGAWTIMFETLVMPTKYVGMLTVYKIFTENYAGACTEAYMTLEHVEAAHKLGAIKE